MSKIPLKSNPNNKFLIWLQTRLTNLETTFISLKSQVSQNTSDIEQLKKGGGGGSTITVDSELSTTSTNPVQNKIITENINHLFKDVEHITQRIDDYAIDDIKVSVSQIESELTSYDSRITTLEDSSNDYATRISTLENQSHTVTGITYQNSYTAYSSELTVPEGAQGNVCTTTLTGKYIPISVYPTDTTTTWRTYAIMSWTYNAENNTTVVTINASDTATPCNVVCLPVLSNE